METRSNPNAVIIYDGVCTLCNWFVRFVIKRDRAAYFQFSPLQSDFAQSKLNDYKQVQLGDSVILLEHGRVYVKSSAVIRILSKLSGVGWLGWLYRNFSPKTRDRIYDWIARNRYRWFGKKDDCPVPDAKIQKRFV